jgi:hypothetical protein
MLTNIQTLGGGFLLGSNGKCYTIKFLVGASKEKRVGERRHGDPH